MYEPTITTHRILIRGWLPARLNQLMGCHWAKAARLKTRDREMIAAHMRLERIPLARTKRGVKLTIYLGPRQRAGDPDSYWKSTLDALVSCGLLVDDNRQWCELEPVEFRRAPDPATTIELTDLEDS